MESTIQIVGEDTRQFYYNAIITKISDLKRYRDSATAYKAASTVSSYENNVDTKRCGVDEVDQLKFLITQAISFKNLFNIKHAVIQLTRSDVDLLTRILDTSA